MIEKQSIFDNKKLQETLNFNTMARILTGIQSTGRPHLGNILGAIMPAIVLSKSVKHQGFFFIADLHTLTTIKNPQKKMHYVNATAAAWLALGLDADKNIFFRQSQIPEVCELAWYLNCFTPYPMLANAHAFKDKANHLSDVNAGLFTYPILMTADMVLYDAEWIPVGKDQLQHVEMARDIAQSLNQQYGEILQVPQAKINDTLKIIPGIDGKKMSKSYHNTIDIFLPEQSLKKNIMGIVTNSTPFEKPKNPAACHVFKLYSLLADQNQTATLRKKYLAGNYGYGDAKKELFSLIMDQFARARKLFDHYMNNLPALHTTLAQGEGKARNVAIKTLARVREKLGY